MRASVARPNYGWGDGVDHNSTGTVYNVEEGEGDVRVNFPEFSHWWGKISEMEVVDEDTEGETCV